MLVDIKECIASTV